MKLTELEKLTEILTWIRSCGVRVRIRQDPGRKARVNGCYCHNTIVVYTQNRQQEASEVATALLHEYGHHVATQCVGLWNHTEQDAWFLAQNLTPPDLLPVNFPVLREQCLRSYAERGLEDL